MISMAPALIGLSQIPGTATTDGGGVLRDAEANSAGVKLRDR
jgi:hypothetical protein